MLGTIFPNLSRLSYIWESTAEGTALWSGSNALTKLEVIEIDVAAFWRNLTYYSHAMEDWAMDDAEHLQGLLISHLSKINLEDLPSLKQITLVHPKELRSEDFTYFNRLRDSVSDLFKNGVKLEMQLAVSTAARRWVGRYLTPLAT